MDVNIGELFRNNNGAHASIIIGANGSGKSRMLRKVAERFIASGGSVAVICNTVYDRFRFLRGVDKIRPHSQLPLMLMKNAIIHALKDGPFRLHVIADTLQYLDYSSDMGLEIQEFNPEQVYVLETFKQQNQGRALVDEAIQYNDFQRELESLYDLNLSLNEIDEIISTVALSKRYFTDNVFWLDFSRNDFMKFENEGLARLIKWEKVLKIIGVLRRVNICLKKPDGVVFDLHEASSGELTLLATITHLAINFVEGGVVVIDEPENSLHPNWQHNYVSRLLDILSVRSPKIFVATHAPIVVSGARALASELTSVYRAENGVAYLVGDIEESLEGTLVEVFGTVTPKNHYLSRQLTNDLGALSRGEISLTQMETKIQSFEKSSYSDKQRDFLKAVNLLAHEVASEKQ